MFLENHPRKLVIMFGGIGFIVVVGTFLLLRGHSAPARPVAVPDSMAESFETDEIIVQDYPLINETRISQTVSDLTFKVSVRNTGGDKIGVSGIGESLSATATFTSPTSVNFGDIPAGAVVTSNDTFTIRNDSANSFDTDQLDWQFATAIEVAKITFLEPGGRPGHGGSSEIQGSSPPAGASFGMITTIYGSPANANYKFVASDGVEIITAPLTKSENDPDNLRAIVTIPHSPFYIEVSGTSQLRVPFMWRSDLYKPAAFSLKIVPSKSLLKKGEQFELKMQAIFPETRSSYSLRLLLPTGFLGFQGPWEIKPVAGQKNEFTTRLTTPTTGDDFVRYPIEAEAIPSDATLESIKSSYDLLVE